MSERHPRNPSRPDDDAEPRPSSDHAAGWRPSGSSGSTGRDAYATSGGITSPALARESGELHRLLVESVQDYAIFALDPHGFILSWNAGAARFKGYTADEIIGKHFSIFYPQERIDQGVPEMELRTAAAVGRYEEEGWRLRKDGTRFWANVVITALRNERGVLVGFGKVTRDLTERRQAEVALRLSEERFRLLVQSVKDYAIFMLDPTGRVTTWNRGAQRIKGYTAAQIIGQHFSKFYPPEDIATRKPERELEIATETGTYEEEGWRLRNTGERFWASVVITAVRGERGELVGFAKVTRDLTERRAAERRALEDARRVAAEEAGRRAAEHLATEMGSLASRLKQQATELEERRAEADEARLRADEANQAKSQFLAAMSHELRTPLNAIGGYADLLALGIGGPINDQQRDQVERIKRSQDHLMRIINDILNFSRIEAGRLRYDIERMSMDESLQSVAHMIAPQAAAKAVEFRADACPPDTHVMADRAKVDQILLNLLSNAVKFTSANGVVSIVCDVSASDRVRVVVRDSGAGIAPGHLDAIFEPFVQVGRSLTNVGEGTGLGLAISRDLARAMHGDITVESALGKGSAFTLTLPKA